MPKASLIIRFKDKELILEGNDDLLWYINEKVKEKTLENILKIVKEFKEMRKRRGKMNIVLINVPDDCKEVLDKFREDFNFIFEKSVQRKILSFIE